MNHPSRKMLPPLGIVVSLVFGLWLTACGPQVRTTEIDGKPKVVSTSTIIADLTDKIAGEQIAHTAILKPGTDPHIYEPVPADHIALEQADLILYNGYNLEPGLIRMIVGSGIQGKKVPVAEAIPPLKQSKDNQQVPDPHVWGNANNGQMMVNLIRDELIALSPADQALFMENAAALTAQLVALHQWIQAQIATIPENQRKLVTTHDAFAYYASAYGLELTGTLIGMSTEEQPSAQTVKNLVDQIQKMRVPAIFAETTINPRLITTVAEEAGVKLAANPLYSDSIGVPGSEADSYIKMLIANTRTIVEALGGNYSEFEGRE